MAAAEEKTAPAAETPATPAETPQAQSSSRNSRRKTRARKEKQGSKGRGRRASNLGASLYQTDIQPVLTKTKPETKAQYEKWLLDTMGEHPLGMTPSAMVHLFYMDFGKPMQLPTPHYMEDEAEEVREFDFAHRDSLPVRDPLKVILSGLPGVVYEQQHNKYVLGDRQELLRIHMKIAVRKFADGAALEDVTLAHWQKLFRKIDRDGSGKLSRSEFHAFVREHMKLSKVDYGDDDVMEVFKALDDDLSGQISVDELVAFAEGRDGCL